MSYSSGTYSLPSGNPVVTGTVISSSWANTTLSDIATVLSTAVLKDGTQTLTANLPMANFKLTGLGAGTALTDSATLSQVQSGAPTYLTSVAGTNTITGSTSPALTAYAAGQKFLLIPAGANTGATTLNVDSLGAKNVFAFGVACVGGELLSGVPVIVSYDGTQFNIEAPFPVQFQPIQGTGLNIAGRTNASTPLSKIDITADQLIVRNTSGWAKTLSTVSVTADITVSGANGLDTGVEASSTWYYGYVIAKPDGTVASLLSVSSSAPTMPSGYTYKALVSAVRNDGSSNFIAYRQFGRRVFYEASQQTALFAKTDTVEASASMVSTVPAISTELLFTLTSAATADGSGIGNITPHLRIVTGVDYYATSWVIRGQGAAASVQPPSWMGSIPNVGQNIFYLLTNTNGTGSMTLNANGFTLPGGGE